MSQLIQTLDFAQSDFQEEKMTEAVGLGCLGLQRYAREYWPIHVVKSTELSHAELSAENPLIKQLLRLVARHDTLSRTFTPATKVNAEDMASFTATDNGLQHLSAFPGVCDLIGRVQIFQKAFYAQQLTEGPGMETSAPFWYLRMKLISRLS